MDGWTETWRGIVSPWECDLTEHFTIAYYFDRLADAAAAMAASLGLSQASRSVGRRLDVRFVRELRAGASFHILSAPIALDERRVRLGHQIINSADGEVTAWVEETLAIAAAQLPRETRDAIARRLLPWPGPAVERRPEPSTTQGFIVNRARPGQAAGSRSGRQFLARGVCPPLHRRLHAGAGGDWRDGGLPAQPSAGAIRHSSSRLRVTRLPRSGISRSGRDRDRASRQFFDPLRASHGRSRRRQRTGPAQPIRGPARSRHPTPGRAARAAARGGNPSPGLGHLTAPDQAKQHFLNFLPLPQGQGSFRPTPLSGFRYGSLNSRSGSKSGSKSKSISSRLRHRSRSSRYSSVKQYHPDNSSIVSPNRM